MPGNPGFLRPKVNNIEILQSEKTMITAGYAHAIYSWMVGCQFSISHNCF